MNTQPRRRPWRRVLVAALVLAVLLRAFLPTLIAAVARSQAEAAGFELALGDIDLSLHEGRASIWSVRLTRDGEPVAAIESLDVDVEIGALFAGDLVVRRAEVDGVDLRLVRGADGRIAQFAGAFGASNAAAGAANSRRGGSEPFVLDSLALPLRVDSARLQRVRVDWRDEAVSPVAALRAELDVSVADLGRADRAASFELRFAAPGAVGLLAADARLSTTATEAQLDANVLATGIEGEAVLAYLAAIGVTPPERSQELRVAVASRVRLVAANQLEGSARLVQSIGQPTGTGTSWFELAEVSAAFAPGSLGTDVELLVKGLALEAERARDGRIVVAGFAVGGPASEQAAPDASAPPTGSAGTAAPALPVRLAGARVESTRLVLVDRAVGDEPVRLEFAVESADVRLDESGSARLALVAAAPGIVERVAFTAEAELLSLRSRGRLELEGLSFERVAPHLAALGLEPSGAAARVTCDLEVDGSSGALDATIGPVSLSSGPATPLQLAALRVVGGGRHGATELELAGFVVRGTSEADGALVLGPLRLVATRTGGAAVEARPFEVAVDARLAGLDLVSGAPATLEFTLAAAGLADRVALGGTVAATRASLALDLELEAVGVRQAALAALRPEPASPGERIALRLAGGFEPHRSGGRALRLDARGVALGERLALEELLVEGRLTERELTGAFTARALAAPQAGLSGADLVFDFAARTGAAGAARAELSNLRLEGAGTGVRVPLVELDVRESGPHVLDVARLAATGIEVDARRRADGALVVAGLVVPAPANEAATSTATGPAPAATAPPAAPTGSSAVPRIVLGALELELARLTLADEARGTDARLAARVATAQPWVLWDPAGLSNTLELELVASLEPGLSSATGRVVLGPDATGASLSVELALEGIDDQGLVAAWPPLGELVAPGGVSAGRFALAARAHLDAPRTGPIAFDLRRSSGASFDLDRLEFAPTPESAPTLALAELRATLAPFGAADAPLRFTAVELAGARAVVEKRADVLAIGGLALRTGAPVAVSDEAAEPTDEAAAAAPVPAAPVAAAPVAPAAPAGGGGRGILVDRLVLSGLDLSLSDTTVEPPTLLPIDELELDVRHLALGAAPRRPVQFRLSVGGGDVLLPDLPKDGAFLANLARELTGAAERTSSSRPWLDELVVSGQVDTSAAPRGWVRTELYGFELTALRGSAQAAGVQIGAGTVDANLRLDLRGQAGVRVDNRTTFTSLSISEPPGGPIARFLKLPAPLDVVLWALENERSEHVVPLEFSVDHSGVSVAELAATGSKALVLLIADALAASPLRIGGGVLDIVGLDLFGGSEATAGDAPPIEVPFADGSSVLDAAGSEAVTAVLLVLARDPAASVRIGHRYSEQDIAFATELALPDPAECLRLARGLEAERAGLVAALAVERDRLARLVATGGSEVALVEASLRREAERLVGLEASLDTLYDLSTEPDERTRTKRVREAALRLAERRFEAFVRDLVARGTQDSLARIQLVRPRLADMASEGAGAALVVTPRAR